MNNFNFVNQFNKISIVFVVMVFVSLTYLFSISIFPENENILIKMKSLNHENNIKQCIDRQIEKEIDM